MFNERGILALYTFLGVEINGGPAVKKGLVLRRTVFFMGVLPVLNTIYEAFSNGILMSIDTVLNGSIGRTATVKAILPFTHIIAVRGRSPSNYKSEGP